MTITLINLNNQKAHRTRCIKVAFWLKQNNYSTLKTLELVRYVRKFSQEEFNKLYGDLHIR